MWHVKSASAYSRHLSACQKRPTAAIRQRKGVSWWLKSPYKTIKVTCSINVTSSVWKKSILNPRRQHREVPTSRVSGSKAERNHQVMLRGRPERSSTNLSTSWKAMPRNVTVAVVWSDTSHTLYTNKHEQLSSPDGNYVKGILRVLHYPIGLQKGILRVLLYRIQKWETVDDIIMIQSDIWYFSVNYLIKLIWNIYYPICNVDLVITHVETTVV